MHDAARLSKGPSHIFFSRNNNYKGQLLRKICLQENGERRHFVMLFESLITINKNLAFPWLLAHPSGPNSKRNLIKESSGTRIVFVTAENGSP